MNGAASADCTNLDINHCSTAKWPPYLIYLAESKYSIINFASHEPNLKTKITSQWLEMRNTQKEEQVLGKVQIPYWNT